ncbi:MAG: DNA-directed RNA polymerase subunit K [Candidatus Woesearchaeota archaeon]|nr:DNA-directed RNA polymerase subunit K [Candidatus Woesearchaeota archaeon]
MKYTKYEKARIIGARALQIAMGAPILIKLDKNTLDRINFDPVAIAEIEYAKDILPITIKRPLPGRVE